MAFPKSTPPLLQIHSLQRINDDNKLNHVFNIRGGSSNGVSGGLPFLNKNPLHYLSSLPAITSSLSSLSSSPPSIDANTNTNTNLSILPFIIIPSIHQITLITILSFTIGEIFNYCGVFQDENGKKAKQKATSFFQSHDSIDSIINDMTFGIIDWVQYQIHFMNDEGGLFHLPTCKRRLERLLNLDIMSGSSNGPKDGRGRGRGRGSGNNNNNDNGSHWSNHIHEMPFKYQFAIGNILGMVLHCSTIMVAKVATTTYILSEITHNFISHFETKPKPETEDYYDNVRDFMEEADLDIDVDFVFEKINSMKKMCVKCLYYMDHKLHRFRCKVRSMVANPQETLGGIFNGTWMDREGTIIVGFVFGIILGHIASSSSSSL